MKSRRLKPSCLAAALLVFSPAGFAQTEDDRGEEIPLEEIEEIVVYGEKSLLHLKKDVERASNVVFESFNALNDDDQFDIHCSDRVPSGSNISEGSCRPNYEDQIYHEATSRQLDMSDGGIPTQGFRTNSAAIEAKLKKKKALMDEKMEALAKENPEFAKALIKLLVAERVFEAERQKRCAGRLICRKSAPE